ncbi:DUF2975 domain-containing protein [Pedobacter frigiditerrae]|uniref:DUF2975 domain-containing protein n=1 Tax=Pedobacter frigiditerrae TaxID=2530452 RepID=UPI002930B0A6|nr:DUF2975 domain-containing protein [Pedobacter frigiditerrae]
MKRVKYYFLARTIKLFLQLGFSFLTLYFFCSLFVDIFNTKSYIHIGGGTWGHRTPGNQVNAHLTFNAADTIIHYKNGERNIYIGDELNPGLPQIDSIKEKIVNQFISYENRDVKIYNSISVPENVQVRVFSKNKLHNLFWAASGQLYVVFVILVFLILIKLTNRYLDGIILLPRSFKLFSFLGLLMIIKEFFIFIVGIINMLIIQHPRFHSTSLLTNKDFTFANVSLDFAHTASLSNIIVGVLIILLAQVLKQAILLKQEQDLTI